jgi:hypothetical protein
MIALIIFLWWLSGFVPCVIAWKMTEGRVTGRDLVFIMLLSWFGLITAVASFVEVISKYWDKKIF